MSKVAGDDLLVVLERIDTNTTGIVADAAVLQNGATGTGNGTALDVSGATVLGVQVTATGIATVTWEGTIDGVNWVAVPLVTQAGVAATTFVTANGTNTVLFARVSGYKQFRARISSYTGGAVTITGHALLGGEGFLNQQVYLATAAGTAVTVAAPADALTPGSPVQVATLAGAYNGATWDRLRVATVYKSLAAVAITAATPVAGWTPTAGKKFRLMGYALSLTVAGSVILKDGAVEILRTPLMAAGVGQAAPPLGNGILSAAANNVLNLDVSASGSVSGYVFGTEE